MDKQQRLKLIGEVNQIIKPVPLRFDGLASLLCGFQVIDIIELDTAFSQYDKDYDAVNGIYKGEDVSMNEYMFKKFGQRLVDIFDLLEM